MSLTFLNHGRVWTALTFLLLCLATNYLQAQTDIGYELRSGYDGNATDPNYILVNGERLAISWTVFPEGMTSAHSLTGDLSIYLSGDTTLDQSDERILSKDVEVVFYQQRIDSLPRILPKGYHYLILSFIPAQAGFEKERDPLVRSVMVMDSEVDLKEAIISHFKTSEYDHNTKLDVTLEVAAKCCATEMGNLNGYLKVFLSKDTLLERGHVELTTFYPDHVLTSGTNTLRFQEDLISIPAFDEYRYVIVSLEDGYFTNAYRHKINKRFVVPLKIISDVSEANERRRGDHPYLTYGSFLIDPADLEKVEAQVMLSEAAVFYEKVNQAIAAAKDLDAAGYLKAADSAFAHVGQNPVSSLLYVHPGTISALYSLYYDIAEQDSAFAAYADLKDIGFRLGEAMNMGTLMDSAYARLCRNIFPVDLEITNAVEKSGYFDNEGPDPFSHGAIRNPVLWREVTAPAVAHYLRITEYEEADKIIAMVREAHDRVLETGMLATPLTTTYPRATYLIDALIHDSDVWGFYLSALRFYSAIGDYETGISIYRWLEVLSRTQDEIFLTDFRRTSARFFETFHDFKSADSLFQVLDTFHIRRAEALNSPIEACYAFNSAALKQRLTPDPEGVSFGRDYAAKMSAAKNSGSWFAFDELVNDNATAFKHGIFSIPGYDQYYLSRIQMLQTQNQYFAASELQKDLAYFLGRDKRYDDALNAYESLFPVENIKLTAFRGSFNEEAQLFNTANHLKTFSRYINLLLEMPPELSPAIRDTAVMTAFRQMLFYHSFILRGNFRMLYNISETTDPAILRKFELWKGYRELLNQVYVADEVDHDDVRKVKTELINSEKELQRMSRDSLYFLEGTPDDFEGIRSRLKPGEVAVEMMRISVNHERYDGAGTRYVAFLVTREAASPKLISWDTPGELLEGRYFNYYRAAITNKFTDTISYTRFLKPITQHLDPSVHKIYFAPDGVFNLLNPATIFNPSSGKFVADETEFRQVASIAYVGPSSEVSIKAGALFGYPEFTREVDFDATNNSAPGTRFSMLSNPVAGLPGTRVEVQSIGKLMKDSGIGVRTYLGLDVTKKNIYNANKTDVLHFATHGYWFDEKSTRQTYRPYASLSHSGLLLSGAQLKGKSGYRLQRDGILTAAEIQNMDLFGTDLVVLSACETGVGEVVPGEGIYGLKRAFQRAGVKHLVTSLWKVDDVATQKFMQFFYVFLLEDKHVDSAFRRAVISLKDEYPEPFYWGAFTVTQFY